MNASTLVRQYFEMKMELVGYGNPKARIWFCGIEDGGEQDEKSMRTALEDWNKRDKPRHLPVTQKEIEEDSGVGAKGGTSIYRFMSYLLGGHGGLPCRDSLRTTWKLLFSHEPVPSAPTYPQKTITAS